MNILFSNIPTEYVMLIRIKARECRAHRSVEFHGFSQGPIATIYFVFSKIWQTTQELWLFGLL